MTTSVLPFGSHFHMPSTDLPEAPPESRDPERIGKTRAQVTVVCCPACGSVSALRKTWRVGDVFAWWQCQEEGCRHMWKEAYLVGTNQRARLV